jgi:hypothetical protein
MASGSRLGLWWRKRRLLKLWMSWSEVWFSAINL